MKHFIAYLATAALLSACSTIVEGSSQEIHLNTNPAGANCSLARNGQVIATVVAPSSAYVEKSKSDIIVTCRKSGYQTATYLNHSAVAGATIGNALAGGLIGWAVDSASGADNKYESPVNLTLVKR